MTEQDPVSSENASSTASTTIPEHSLSNALPSQGTRIRQRQYHLPRLLARCPRHQNINRRRSRHPRWLPRQAMAGSPQPGSQDASSATRPTQPSTVTSKPFSSPFAPMPVYHFGLTVPKAQRTPQRGACATEAASGKQPSSIATATATASLVASQHLPPTTAAQPAQSAAAANYANSKSNSTSTGKTLVGQASPKVTPPSIVRSEPLP